jgi:hypothetical protein
MIQNLITKKDKEDLKTGYRLRRLITFNWCIFFASLIAFVLLIPPYITAFYRVGSISHKKEVAVLSADKQVEILNQVKVINKKTNLTLSLRDSLDIVRRITEVNGKKSNFVSLETISYGKEGEPVIKLGGIARDRESLINFQKAVQEIEFVRGVKIPVSDFAKDTNLPFSMEITTTK